MGSKAPVTPLGEYTPASCARRDYCTLRAQMDLVDGAASDSDSVKKRRRDLIAAYTAGQRHVVQRVGEVVCVLCGARTKAASGSASGALPQLFFGSIVR